jgi:ABC-type Na+ transport system ATPase subunit NatA
MAGNKESIYLLFCSFIKNLKIDDYTDKQAKKLSGGTKRKVIIPCHSIQFSIHVVSKTNVAIDCLQYSLNTFK